MTRTARRSNIREMLPLLEGVAKQGRPLLVPTGLFLSF
jgi:hypothetical protein